MSISVPEQAQWYFDACRAHGHREISQDVFQKGMQLLERAGVLEYIASEEALWRVTGCFVSPMRVRSQEHILEGIYLVLRGPVYGGAGIVEGQTIAIGADVNSGFIRILSKGKPVYMMPRNDWDSEDKARLEKALAEAYRNHGYYKWVDSEIDTVYYLVGV
jgi:hypothetical protein